MAAGLEHESWGDTVAGRPRDQIKLLPRHILSVSTRFYGHLESVELAGYN